MGDHGDSSEFKKVAEAIERDEVNRKKLRLEALESIAFPVNKGMLDAIKSLSHQQTIGSSMYSPKSAISGITEMFKKKDHELNTRSASAIVKEQADLAGRMKKLFASQDAQLKKSLAKVDIGNFEAITGNGQKKFEIDRFTTNLIKGNRDREQKERKQKDDVAKATINQTKLLEKITEQNVLMESVMTSLVNHTVQFEELKAKSSGEQRNLSVLALWAATISAFISTVALLYSIFFQASPIVNVAPPVVNVAPTEVKTDKIEKILSDQLNQIKKLNRSLAPVHKRE